MLKKLLLINGFPLSGKDAFADAVRAECDLRGVRVRKISTVDKVKEAWKVLGWDGVTKDEDNRAGLHELKIIWSRYMDGSFKYVCAEAQKAHESLQNCVLLVDSREPEELMRFREAFGPVYTERYVDVPNYNASTVLVRRENHGALFTNPADTRVEELAYDFVVTNIAGDKWKQHLRAEARRVLGDVKHI